MLQATEIKPGDTFKMPGTRKEYTAKVVLDIDTFATAPEEQRGCMLVVTTDCRQLKIRKSAEVILIQPANATN